MLAIRRDEDIVSFSASVGVNVNANLSVSISINITICIGIRAAKRLARKLALTARGAPTQGEASSAGSEAPG